MQMDEIGWTHAKGYQPRTKPTVGPGEFMGFVFVFCYLLAFLVGSVYGLLLYIFFRSVYGAPVDGRGTGAHIGLAGTFSTGLCDSLCHGAEHRGMHRENS